MMIVAVTVMSLETLTLSSATTSSAGVPARVSVLVRIIVVLLLSVAAL